MTKKLHCESRRDAMKRPSVPEEFDLIFLRDLKHRLRMMLRDVEKREKLLKKEISFVKGARKVPNQEQVKASMEFYRNIRVDPFDQIHEDPFEENMEQLKREGKLR